MKHVLVIGGAGYIGSHLVQELAKTEYVPVVYDNLSTGNRESLDSKIQFVQGDVRDSKLVLKTIQDFDIKAIMHFAAASLVGDSMINPAFYYNNNVLGMMSLLDCMRQAQVKNIIFSSTCAVYGEPNEYPMSEKLPTLPTNVYGRTKLACENMLADYGNAYGIKYVSMRYFNAAGASLDARIGEAHNPETHLIPLVLQTALGQRSNIKIFGTDYPTKDGTCVRDYIHVLDLAEAHILGLRHLFDMGDSKIYNLGSEDGFSVKEVINLAAEITAKKIDCIETERRDGDPAMLVATARKVREELGWQQRHSDLSTIIKSAWAWHSK